MENIRNSLWGYNKNDVKNLIFEKDQIIHTQQKDIEYLRAKNQTKLNENSLLDKNIIENNNSRFINLEQTRLNEQIDYTT